MSRIRAAALVLAAVAGFAGPAAGQISGRVADERSRPLPSVPVEIWSEGRRVATRRTAADGGFRFEAGEASGPVVVRARMLGYSPAERTVSPPASGLLLELAPAALPIEGITASATPRVRCPAREDPEARALWREVKAGYDPSVDSMGVSFYSKRADVTTRSPFELPPDDGAFVHSWYGVGGRVRQELPHHAPPYEYGHPILTSFDPAYMRWRYRDLATTDAAHFIGDSFGAAHSLSVLARRGATTILGFCPLRPSAKAPAIRGALTVERGAGLLRAEWTFQTPSPAEDAGGEVTFVPRGTGRSPLLPARTLFWRKLLGRQLYFSRWEHFATYEFLPPDVQPLRPDDWLFAAAGGRAP